MLSISAKNGAGVDKLKERIYEITVGKGFEANIDVGGKLLISTVREKEALGNCLDALTRAIKCIEEKSALEATALEVRTAIDFLGELTGETTTEDILSSIFDNFCIGK